MLWLAALSIPSDAQDPVAGRDKGIGWGIDVLNCARSGDTCVLYGPQVKVQVVFGLHNYGSPAIRLPPLDGSLLLEIEHATEGRLEVTLEWLGKGHQRSEGRTSDAPSASREELTFSAGDSVTDQIAISRIDGLPFRAGSYRMAANIGPAVDRARADSGRPWRGRLSPARTVTFAIRDVETLEDRIAYHDLEAGRLWLERNALGALPHFEALLQLSPANVTVLVGLGRVYLALDRYADSARVLEQALPLILAKPEPNQRRMVTAFLAAAYVRLKQEPEARRVLRLAGRTEAEAAAEVERIRRLKSFQ
jgi:hypothetical protein